MTDSDRYPLDDTTAPAMIIAPDPDAPGLSQPVTGVDETGRPVTLPVVTEKPLTLFLNRQEIVTSMTIGDWPAELAVGYFLNQNMLHHDDVITGIDHDDDLGVVIVRTERETDFEAKMKLKIRTVRHVEERMNFIHYPRKIRIQHQEAVGRILESFRQTKDTLCFVNILSFFEQFYFLMNLHFG